MKVIKSFILLILLMGAGEVRSAEGYLENNPVWTYGTLQIGLSQYYLNSINLFTIQGDSLFEGVNYKKLLYQYSNYSYTYLLRESGKKWYIRSQYNPKNDVLLYDFGAGLGDTIRAPGSTGYTYQYIVVTKVDTITMENGERRKRMTFNEGTWIEGIGDIRLFLGPIQPIPTCGIGCMGQPTMLLCFKQNSTVLYSDQTYTADCCTYTKPQGLQTTARSQGLQWLLSNDGMLDYLLPDRTQVIRNAKLLNLSGCTVWEARAGFDSGGGRISVSHLPHGIYMLSVRTTQGVVVQKVSL
jgi:hypothetical protein